MSDYSLWKHRLEAAAEKAGTPLSMECELTVSCNFRCPMCYAREDFPKGDLTTGEWIGIFDAAAEAGVLFAVLTGGEPLMRPDFWKIYEHLISKGIRVTLFTNGYFLDEAAVERLKKNPPQYVAISLYGHSPETVEKNTGRKDGFLRTDAALDRLAAARIPHLVRTVASRGMYEILPELLAYVKSKGLRLGYQPYLAPSLQDRLQPFKERLTPRELAYFEAQIHSAFPEPSADKNQEAVEDDPVFCQALKSACFVSHDGFLRPCPLADEPSVDLRKTPFLPAYRQAASQWKELLRKSPCSSCELKSRCLGCRPRRALEGCGDSCGEYLRGCAEERSVPVWDVAGIKLAYQPLYPEYYGDRLRPFSAPDARSFSRRFTVRVGDPGPLPDRTPDFVHLSKVSYKEGNQETLYLFEGKDRERLMQKVVFDEEYRDVDIVMSPAFGDRLPEIEYLATGMFFFEMAVREGFFPFHASAIVHQGEAILFSAPSGIGKSTHADLWLKHLPEARYLNDDKPLLSFKDGKLCASGTPWCGKTENTANLTVPVKAIVFLSRGEKPRIKLLSEAVRMALLMKNGFRSRKEETVETVLGIWDRILKSGVEMVGYETDISEEAFQKIYHYLYGGMSE